MQGVDSRGVLEVRPRSSRVLGGLTTFSVFGLESLWLMQSGDSARAVFYVVVPLVLWIARGWLASRMGRRWNAVAAGS